MQGFETYCGDLKESPIKPKMKKNVPPHRIVTLDGIMEDGDDLRFTRNRSGLARTNILNEQLSEFTNSDIQSKGNTLRPGQFGSKSPTDTNNLTSQY